MTKLSERQVKRHLQTLADEDNKVITIAAGDGRGHTSVYTILGVIKGDIQGIKGDADVTLLPYERVTSRAERVTSMTIKGDADVTQTIKNHKEPSYIYVHPDDDDIAEIKTALSTVSKTPLWSPTENEYDQAAHMVKGWDCTGKDVKAFGGWWVTNGWHKGKPVLSVVLSSMRDYLDTRSSNGHKPQDLSWIENIPTFTEEEIASWQE